jgi:hypothetical protein
MSVGKESMEEMLAEEALFGVVAIVQCWNQRNGLISYAWVIYCI